MKKVYEGLVKLQNLGSATRITISKLGIILPVKERLTPALVIETDAAYYICIQKGVATHGRTNHSTAR